MDFNDNEFEDFDNDPLYREELESMYEEELERSMIFAYTMIEEMGIDIWTNAIGYSAERKILILRNMIDWYEKREEFEKCAFLLKGIRKLSPNDWHMPDL